MTWQDWILIVLVALFFWGWAWFQLAIWDEQYRERTSWEYTRAHVGTNYGRHTIEEKEAEGWEICSEIDPRYGSVWMRRPAC